MTYYFDMDGTLADFYGVDGWKKDLDNENVRPYAICKPLVNMNKLAHRIHKVQRAGNRAVIISWTSKTGTAKFNAETAEVKRKWLKEHLPSVKWDEIKIIPYGTNKKSICGNGILFDDEERNRKDWGEGAHTPAEIFEVMT